MNKKQPHIAVFGLKGFPAIGGTSAVGENLVRELNNDYRFTIYGTSSHCKEKHPYQNVRMFIIQKFLPHKLNVFYYHFIAALHALFFGNYDLVHTHQIDTGYIVPLLRLRYQVVSTHHGRTYKMSKWGKGMKLFFRCTEWMMIRFANQVTFVAETERKEASKKYGGQYLTIFNGINPNQALKEVNVDEDYIMFAAGRIIPHKGCHIFLEALKLINYQGLVVIAGDHHQMESYRRKLESYKNDLNIQFLGMLHNKAELLGYVKRAKLFVFPSYYEAMSMMLLEVALVKIPMICSDIEENKDVFNDKEVSYFKVGDEKDLAEKIKWALANNELIRIKADLAHHKLSSSYRWETIGKKYAAVYSSFIQKNLR